MSLEISVAVVIMEGETRWVNVGRVETLIPALAGGDETQQDLDLLDLARAAATRLISEVSSQADEQITQLRALRGSM